MDQQVLHSSRILPVVVIDDADTAVPLAETLLDAGLGAIEVTFRTPAAAAAIASIRKTLPDIVVSAGTVLTPEQAKRAIDAGAQFGLAPGIDQEIIAIFQAESLPFVPGVMTPSDVQAALKLGCTHLKFFPAEAAGGLPLLKSLIAPFKSSGCRFCPTGGLKQSNMSDYLAVPEVFAIGGTWLATPAQISNRQWEDIKVQAQTAVVALNQIT